MCFFRKSKKGAQKLGKQLYLVEIKFVEEGSNEFRLLRIQDRNGNPLIVDPNKLYSLSETGGFPVDIVMYISRLTGESENSIEYHVNEESK